MRRKGLSKQKRLRLTLASSLFVVLTIPLAIFALLNTESFDPTSDASEASVNSLACNFEFIYINPETIEAGSNVQLEVRGRVYEADEVITSVSITDADGVAIFKKDYSEPITSFSETFIYNSDTEPDTTTILGTLSSNLDTYPCTLYDALNNSIRTLQTNLAPVFQTDPYTASVPSTVIEVDDNYSYKLIAVDAEDDDIEYNFSFTPGADWLGLSVVKDGSDGDLELNFSGSPETPESYLANVFIHDGYTSHLRSQSWVISVEQGENDTPVVAVTEPIAGTTITQGTVLRISWSATDQNQIVQYKIYYASNPANQSTWVAINENVSYDIGTYLFDTSSVPTGTYKIIVQAVDNQTPAAVGTGVSEAFGVNARPVTTPTDPVDPTDPTDPDNDNEPDDGVRLEDPQIINISPEAGSEVTNKRRTISATLIASKDAEIDLESIQFFVDNKDLNEKIEISEISEYEATVIYKPEEDLSDGEHKVRIQFKDSEDKEADRTWTFKVVSDEEDDDTYNIFGYKIPKRTAIIIAAGLAILLLALLIPWLLYLAWRNSDDDYDIYATNTYGYDNGGGGNTYNNYNTTPAKSVTTEKTTTTQQTSSGDPVVRTPILHTKTETKNVISPTPVTPVSTTTTTPAPVSTFKPSSTTETTTTYKYPTVGNNSAPSTPPASSGTIVNNISVPKAPDRPVQTVSSTSSAPISPIAPTPAKPASTPIAYPPKADANLTVAKPNIQNDRKDEIVELAEKLKSESAQSNAVYSGQKPVSPQQPQPATNAPGNQSGVQQAQRSFSPQPQANTQPVAQNRTVTPTSRPGGIPRVTPSQPLPQAPRAQQPNPAAPSAVTAPATNTQPASAPKPPAISTAQPSGNAQQPAPQPVTTSNPKPPVVSAPQPNGNSQQAPQQAPASTPAQQTTNNQAAKTLSKSALKTGNGPSA